MSSTKYLRKFLTILSSGGATLALGFLTFAGMFAVTSSLPVCLTAFILAVAFEGQVNDEGIGQALRRIFGKKYLKRGIIRQYLEDILPDLDDEEDDVNGKNKESKPPKTEASQEKSKIKALIDSNAFLKDYHSQKKYLKKLEKLDHPTKDQREKIKRAKKQLRVMEAFLLRQVETENKDDTQLNRMERAARDLIQKDKERLRKEMWRKTWLIRCCWLFAAAAGISSGLATLSAIQVGVTSFAILSAIPGGVIVAVSVLAAAGYALLLYQAVSDMIQEFPGKLKSFFTKRKNEPNFSYGFRLTAAAFVVAVGIVATLATAGTWWYAAKEGGTLLNFGEKAASWVRSITVTLMALPNFIFGTVNSISTIDDITRSQYSDIVKETKESIKETWKNESTFQFFNPFRAIANGLSYAADSLLFLGHIVSVSFSSNGDPSIPVGVSVVANSASEAGQDMPYLPDEKKGHHHHSLGLTLLYLPVTLVVGVLKCFAVLWDVCSTRSLKESVQRIFPKHDQKTPEPEAPVISPDWRKQHVIEVCDQTIERLDGKSPAKVLAAQNIKTTLHNDDQKEFKVEALRTEAKPLEHQRSRFFTPQITESKKDMDLALDYLASPAVR